MKSTKRSQKEIEKRGTGDVPFCKKSKNAQNSSPVNDLIGQLDRQFLVKHPPSLLEFWHYALEINQNAPLDAFKSLNSVKLVGPFRMLNDMLTMRKGDKSTSNYLVSDRFSTDLPEMETIILYRNGRFCYWRDSPDELPSLIVHVDNDKKNFPAFTLAGNENLFSALAFLVTMKSKNLEGICKKQFSKLAMVLEMFDKKFFNSLVAQRSKTTYGKPFHGLGIQVEVVNDLGYRPLTESSDKLRNEIFTYATTREEEQKASLKEHLFSLYTCVQFANDEMDFGMGLEFGHDLFVSGYECFDGMARSVLKTAYELLKREAFAKILEAQFEHGRRSNDEMLTC